MLQPVFIASLAEYLARPIVGHLLSYEYNRKGLTVAMLSSLPTYVTHAQVTPDNMLTIPLFPFMADGDPLKTSGVPNTGNIWAFLEGQNTIYENANAFYADGEWTSSRFLYQQLRRIELSNMSLKAFKAALDADILEDAWTTEISYADYFGWQTDIDSGRMYSSNYIDWNPAWGTDQHLYEYKERLANPSNPNSSVIDPSLEANLCGVYVTQLGSYKRVRVQRELDSLLILQGSRPTISAHPLTSNPEGSQYFEILVASANEILDSLVADGNYTDEFTTIDGFGNVTVHRTVATLTSHGVDVVNTSYAGQPAEYDRAAFNIKYGPGASDAYDAAASRSFTALTGTYSYSFTVLRTVNGEVTLDASGTRYAALGSTTFRETQEEAAAWAPLVPTQQYSTWGTSSSSIPVSPFVDYPEVVQSYPTDYASRIATMIGNTRIPAVISVTQVRRNWSIFIHYDLRPMNEFLPNELSSAHLGSLYQIGWIDTETGEFTEGQSAQCTGPRQPVENWVVPEIIRPPASDPVFIDYKWDSPILSLPGGSFFLQDGSIAPLYPTFKGAYVLDLHLSKWGRYVGDYKRLLDYQAINNFQPGQQSYARFGVFGGIVDAAGKIRLFNDTPSFSYIKYGKMGYYRQGMTTVEEAIMHHRVPVTGRLKVETSLDGNTLGENLTVQTAYNKASNWRQDGGFSGRWHNIVAEGQFDISYLEFRGIRQGKR
jgi:hypothetical protein